jgi:hypothetical protein
MLSRSKVFYFNAIFGFLRFSCFSAQLLNCSTAVTCIGL